MATKRTAADAATRRGFTTRKTPVHHAGKAALLITEVEAEPDSGTSPCVTNYQARFFLDHKDGKGPIHIGTLVGMTIDKELRHSTKRSRRGPSAALWLAALLTPPQAYEGDPLLHAGPEGDEMSDMQKTMQLLFTPAGEVQEDVKLHATLLQAGTQIHFIHYYCLFKEWRGKKGFGQVAIREYLEALKSVSEDFDFQGTVILPPAPLFEELNSEIKPGQQRRGWLESKDSLIPSYEDSGFIMIRRGDPTMENAISIMALSTDAMRPLPQGSKAAMLLSVPMAQDGPSKISAGVQSSEGNVNRDWLAAHPNQARFTLDPADEVIEEVLVRDEASTAGSFPEDDLADTAGSEDEPLDESSSEDGSEDESDDFQPSPRVSNTTQLSSSSMAVGWTSTTRSGQSQRQILVPAAVRGSGVTKAEQQHLRHKNDTLTFEKRKIGALYPWPGGLWYEIDEHTDPAWVEEGWRRYREQKELRSLRGLQSAMKQKAKTWPTNVTPKVHPHGDVDPSLQHDMINIVGERSNEYLVQWAGADSDGNAWNDTWEDMDDPEVEPLEEEWEQRKAMRRDEAGSKRWTDEEEGYGPAKKRRIKGRT